MRSPPPATRWDFSASPRPFCAPSATIRTAGSQAALRAGRPGICEGLCRSRNCLRRDGFRAGVVGRASASSSISTCGRKARRSRPCALRQVMGMSEIARAKLSRRRAPNTVQARTGCSRRDAPSPLLVAGLVDLSSDRGRETVARALVAALEKPENGAFLCAITAISSRWRA